MVKGHFPFENHTVSLRDLSSYSGRSSLTDFFQSLNIKHENTNQVLVGLSQVKMKILTKINELYSIFDFPLSFHLTEKTLPSSFGSITAKLLERFLLKEMSLDETGHFNEQNFMTFDQINKTAMFYKKETEKYNLQRALTLPNSNYEFRLLNSCSSRTLSEFYGKNTGIFNAVLHGGRTYNERSPQFIHELVADIDFVSCYGTALSEFSYPIGLPTLFALTKEEKGPTLKEFLAIHEKELVDNLYTITISSKKLSFQQDFLYSKISDKKQLIEKIQKRIKTKEFINEKKLDADFVLLRQQLCNTILTADLIKIIRKIATSKELKEIMESEVITACYYKKSDYLEKQEFLDFFKNNQKKSYYYETKVQNNIDLRPRKWTKIELKGLINPLLEKRNQIKKQLAFHLTDQERMSLNSQQFFYKNVINTIFGVLGSPYFSVSKPLLGIQSITDGFLYSVNETIAFRNDIKNQRKPGFDTLSLLNKNFSTLIDRHKSFKIQPLGDKTSEEWKQIYITNNKIELCKVNDLAEEANRKFWERYDLQIQYKLEHKNFGLKSFNVLKAHYAIQLVDPTQDHFSTMSFHALKSHYILKPLHSEEMIFKCRGLSIENDTFYKTLAQAYFQKKEVIFNPKEMEEKLYSIIKKKQTGLCP